MTKRIPGPAGNQTFVFQFVSRHYTDRALPALVGITKTDYRKLGSDCVDWIHLARDMLGFCDYSYFPHGAAAPN